MAKLGGSVSIARSPADVFAYLDDLARRPSWQQELTTTKVLTDGPVRVGTEVEETRQMGKQVFTSRWRVTEYDPPRRSAFETYEGKMLRPAGVITVAPDGTGSRVTFEMEPKPMGFAKLMMSMIGRSIQKNITADLANLKANLEAGS